MSGACEVRTQAEERRPRTDAYPFLGYTAAVNSKGLSQERFGRFAASYVKSATHAAGPDLQRIVELVGEHPTWRALDVATGGGHTALAVAPPTWLMFLPQTSRSRCWQAGSSEDLFDLRRLLMDSPESVKQWMRPSDIQGPQASFCIVHGLFTARKHGVKPKASQQRPPGQK